MSVFFLAPLIAAIAFLSRPGSISRNPVSRVTLLPIESLVVQRILALMLIIPTLLLSLSPTPYWLNMTETAGYAIVTMLLAIPPLAWLIARGGRNDGEYAHFGGLRFGNFFWWVYLLSTICYMVLYEVLIRGVLLNSLTDHLSVILAIAANTGIYAAMHLFKSVRESLLCLPTGVLLCWMTIATGSVWPAACFHLLVALSFELIYSQKLKPLHD